MPIGQSARGSHILLDNKNGTPISGAFDSYEGVLQLRRDEIGALQVEIAVPGTGTAPEFMLQGRLEQTMPFQDLLAATVTADEIVTNVPLCPYVRIRQTIAGAVDWEARVALLS